MSPDEKILSSAEIVQNANSFTSLYFSQRGLSGVSDEEKRKRFMMSKRLIIIFMD